VALLDDIISRLIQPILDKVKRWLGPFGKLIDHVIEGYKHLLNIGKTLVDLRDEIVGEIKAWQSFKEDIHFRTRVISLPIAVEQTRNFIEGFATAWHAIIDLFKDIQRTIKGAPEPEDLAKDVESAVSSPDSAEGLAKLFPKLAKLGERVLGAVLIIVQGLEGLSDALDDFKKIVDQAKAVREEIETGATVFLKQSNRRKTVRLDDGTTMKIRVGKLHQLS
jgi:hypothetical protein